MKKRVLQFLLGVITKKIVTKYRPKVIAITGSVGKTSTKRAIKLLLETKFNVRSSAANLNTEFGVPLVFIGEEEGGGSSWIRWAKIIISGLFLIVKKDKEYPQIIITEMGADKRGDISYLTSLAKPDIGIITMVGEIPVHIENYNSLKDIVEEETEIVKKTDFAIINFDDLTSRKAESKSDPIFFGFNDGADIKISNFKIETRSIDNRDIPYGSSFNITTDKEEIRIHLPYCIGKPFAYSVAAALACGSILDVGLDYIKDIFRELRPEKGRMQMIVQKKYLIIDDTYNASPDSMASSLETIKSLPGPRKVAILGDMKELGDYSIVVHRDIGELVVKTCDVLITVGDKAKEIAGSATRVGMNYNFAYSFDSNSKLIDRLEDILEEGDVVLVKGSRSMKMEEIVQSIIK